MLTIRELDGKGLYYSFLAGAQRLLNHQQLLNALNVFPVPDADTGTNLAFTFRWIMDKVKPDRSLAVTAGGLAEAALEGARGNSGVIFAQFIEGFSLGAQRERAVDTRAFTQLVQRAAASAREAIARPVEGTIITVMDDWARAVRSIACESDDFSQVLARSQDEAHRSLKETTNKLPVLAEAGVVDAGAKGFVLFLEGIVDLLRHRRIKSILAERGRSPRVVSLPRLAHAEIKGRYCTEILLKTEGVDLAEVRRITDEFGDSVVVAGTPRKVRVHLHTDCPAEFVSRLGLLGGIPQQKAEDLLRQMEDAREDNRGAALVTDSSCDLPQEIIDRYRIHVIPLSLLVGQNNYLDKLTITPDRLYRLMETSPDYPSTALPGDDVFRDFYGYLLEHYPSIIALHLSGELSGTLAAARRVGKVQAQSSAKEVAVIDSRSISGGLGLLTLRAARALEEGMDHRRLVESVGQWIGKVRIMVGVRTMNSLVRSGRVSPMKGALAKILHLKPLVSVIDGRAVLSGKAFSQRANMGRILKKFKTDVETEGLWDYIVLHVQHADLAASFAGKLAKVAGKPPLCIMDVAPVIGLHVGRGAVAVAYLLA